MILRILLSIYLLQITTLIMGNVNGVKIVSWNLRDFGKSRDEEEIRAIAQILRSADVVAIQEVVAIDPGGAQAVSKLVEELDRSGADWDYTLSDPTNSPSHYISERYAFLWKKHKATLVGKAILMAEVDEAVHREPFIAKFKINNSLLTLVNYHSRTHKKDSDDESLEINAISNYLLNTKFDNILWSGDFNLEISHEAFKTIKSNGYQNCLNGEKTTLKKKCNNGTYLSRAEDNMVYKLKDFRGTEAKVIDFVGSANCINVEELQLKYSDHLPIQILLNTK